MRKSETSPGYIVKRNWKREIAICLVASLLTLSWYLLIHAWREQAGFLLRYTAGHPIEYLETFLFAWAACWLCAYLVQQHSEFARLRWLRFDCDNSQSDAQTQGNENAETGGFSDNASLVMRRWRQFCSQLQHNPKNLDDELRHWDEENTQLSDSEYHFVRYLIWAIPILGFLGTVIGITDAIGSVRPEEIAGSISGVTSGLAIAFDTTAIALTYSLALMLLMFICQRRDDLLLTSLAARLRSIRDEFHHKHGQLIGGVDFRYSELSLDKYCREHLEHWQRAFTQQWQACLQMACEQLAKETERWQQTYRALQQQWQEEWQESYRQLLAVAQSTLSKYQELGVELAQSTRQLGEAQARAVEILASEQRILQLQETVRCTLQSLAQAEMLNKAVHSLVAAVHLLTSHVQISRAA